MGVLDLLASGLGQMGVGVLSAWQQSRATRETDEAIAEQIETVDAGLRGLQAEAMRMFEEGRQQEGEYLIRMGDYLRQTMGERGTETLGRYTERFDETFGDFNKLKGVIGEDHANLIRDIVGQVGELNSNLMTGYGVRQQSVMGPLTAAGEEITGGYGELRERGMGYLEGAGEQARADIGERYGNLAATQAANLVERGLGSTTVAPTMEMGVRREESGELRRHDEAIRQQQLEWDTLLTGQELGARERGAERQALYGSQLSGDTLAAMERMGIFGTGAEADLRSNELAARTNLGLYGTEMQGRHGETMLGAESGLDQMLGGLDAALMGDYASWQGLQNAKRLATYTGTAYPIWDFLASIQHQYPELQGWGQNTQNLGYNALYSPPEAETDWLSMGIGAGGGLLAASAFPIGFGAGVI